MKLIDNFNGTKTILFIMEDSDYNDKTLEVVKSIKNAKICYVTLNKTASSLSEFFKRNKIKLDNIIFVDAITKTFNTNPKKENNYYFCSSPGSLTELSIVIEKLLRKSDYLIFDSITNILVYQPKAPVVKFISHISNKTKKYNSRGIFYVICIKEHESILKKIGLFVDKIIKNCNKH